MRFNPHELNVCGITPEQFEAKLDLLRTKIGPCVTEKLEARTQLDIGLINRICACAAFIRELGNVTGFDRVALAITQDPRASPHEPCGQWLQLLVAYIIKSGRHDIALEEQIDGKPKDVVLLAEKVIIECKYFTRGDREQARIQEFLESGQVSPEPPDLPDAFTTRSMLWPAPPGIPSDWIPTNHYRRFFSNGVDGKYAQLVEGWCNIIAINTEWISREIHHLKEPLESLLEAGEYRKLAGFLLIQKQPLSREDYKAQGERFLVSLVERRGGAKWDGVQLPQRVRDSIQQWNTHDSAPD